MQVRIVAFLSAAVAVVACCATPVQAFLLNPPVVTASVPSETFAIGGPAVAVDPGITVTSFDSQITGATETITNLGPNDVLNFTPEFGISSFYGGGVLTLFGSASPIQYQLALQSVTFSTTSDPGTRNIAIFASDTSATPTSGNPVSEHMVVTPEPTSAVMMALGALGLLLAARRRQR